MTLAESSAARGEATGDEIGVRQLGIREETRITLSADKLVKGKLVRTIRATREKVPPLLRPKRQVEPPTLSEVRAAIGDTDGEWEIYVDGSWRVGPSPPAAVFFDDMKTV